MDEMDDKIIHLKIHQSQFDKLYEMLLNTFFEGDTKRIVDLLYRTIRVPFRKKGDQLALILLDRRRQGIVAAFLIRMQSGGVIQSIETIPLDLSYNGQKFSDIFKVKSTEFPQALENLQALLHTKLGTLWTIMVIDFNQISKLFFLLDFEPTKGLIGKVVKAVIDRIKEEKIHLIPIPEVVNAIEKIL